jgi:virginiamycin B lyase
MGALSAGILVGVLVAPTFLINAAGASPTITDYSLSPCPPPNICNFPLGIAAGSDGAIWFTEYNSNKIGRITTDSSHTITEYPLPPTTSINGSRPIQIAAGPDGALWFTEEYGNKIGRITTDPSHAISEYPIKTSDSHPGGIAAGPDGALWFAEYVGNKIGRIPTTATPSNPQITEYPLPFMAGPGQQPFGIATGPDGALWFTEVNGNKIGRIPTTATPSNPQITEYPLTTPGSGPFGIAAGPDRALWFTVVGNIARIPTTATPTNTQITEYPIQAPGTLPDGIALGPDRAMWYTVEDSNHIGRITTDSSHTVTEYIVPTAASAPFWIAAGSDLAMWFTERDGNKIGRITVPCDEGDGEGDIQGSRKTNKAHFFMDADRCEDGDPEVVSYQDPDTGTNFKSTRIDSVSFDKTASALTITGTGYDGTVPVTFTVVAVDLGSTALDSFSIVLSDGYQNSGHLLSGLITLH